MQGSVSDQAANANDTGTGGIFGVFLYHVLDPQRLSCCVTRIHVHFDKHDLLHTIAWEEHMRANLNQALSAVVMIFSLT